MALYRMRYFGLKSSSLFLQIKNCNYQKNILCLSTTVSSHSIAKNDKPSNGIVKRYENFIEKKFPRYYLVHRQIVDGCKLCFSELKMYISLRNALKSNQIEIENFSKKDIECYIQFPPDFLKIVTVIVLLQFPIIGEFIILMSFLAPKYVFTRHFWSTPKYKEFLSNNLISKSQSHFTSLLSSIKLKEGLSLPIKVSEIKDNNIFISKLEEMDRNQLYHLLRFYQLSPFNGITKLKERALLIHCLDNIIKNNNNIDTMDERELIKQLYIRRIMFTNDESIDILRERLKEWLKYSEKIYKDGNESFALYVPILTQGIKN